MSALGRPYLVRQLDHSTRTASEAARAVGCQVAQIAKSLVFRGQASGRPVLVIASGANRVSEKRLADLIGEVVVMADPDFVRQQTGYSIGGIPPFGHGRNANTMIFFTLGTTTALITHNAGIAAMADRVIHLADGRIASIGTNATRTSAREIRW